MLLKCFTTNIYNKYLKAQLSLSVDGLAVGFWVYTANVGFSNPHRVASYNFLRNKFCKPSVNDCF